MHVRKTHLALAVATAVLSVAGCSQQVDQAAASAQQIDQATRSAKIDKVADLEMIGTTIEFFERTAGDPVRATEWMNNYEVDGCPVTVGLAGRSVDTISIDLIPGCKLDFAGIAGGREPIPVDGPLTFGEFEQIAGHAEFKSPCLSGCGNAYDPYVEAIAVGSRADNFRVVVARTQFIGDAAISASRRWQEAITARAGEDYVMNTRFNCEPTFDPEARVAFADVAVESITFGGVDIEYPCY